MTRGLPLFACCVLLALACLSMGVSANQKLVALRPSVLRNNFPNGTIYAEPSLFGLPNYQADISGILKIDTTSTSNIQGCNDYSAPLAPVNANNETDPNAPQSIALVYRGGCSFAQKALKAQAAGASAIVVYSYDDSLPLPKMSGGDDTRNIQIPGAIITKSTGSSLLKGVQKWISAQNANNASDPFYDGVWVSFAYSLIAPDDRVEFDLYTYPDEDDVQQFIMEFGEVVTVLAEHAYFTPHYRIIDGRTHGCTPSPGEDCIADNLACGSQCSNCGRYCRLDPNGDLETRPDGMDQVQESALAKCLWLSASGQANPSLWWDYVHEHDINIACTRQNPYPDGNECSKTAMRLVGLSEAEIDSIFACTGHFGYLDNVDNDILEAEIAWAKVWQPLTSPYLYVNNITYYGGYQCPAPAGPSTCGPLSMICQGYLANTAPPICGTVSTNGCPAGVIRDACGECGGSATKDDACEKKSSFPVGAVIAVVIVCCVLIGGGVYIYMRRQNNRMRDDIDSLLKQYLPLDGSNSTNGNTAASRGGQNANLRLINNLEASDEATDL